MTTQVFRHLLLNSERRVLTADGHAVELQARTFDLLAFLAAAQGRVVSREEIHAAVWQNQLVVANNLTVQMSMLRRVLAQHGQPDAIQTVAGRGYRFVGQVAEAQAPRAPEAAVQPPPPARPARLWQSRPLLLAAGVLGLGLAAGLGVSARHGARGFAAHVRVESRPDELFMAPEGFCRVDYRFMLDEPGEVQLMTEDMRFDLTSGEPVSALSVRGRIYHGSFPIRGPGLGVYHNNLYLPGRVVAAARANGRSDVYLHHVFHLADPDGREVSVPGVVRIVFSDEAQACKPVHDADLPR